MKEFSSIYILGDTHGSLKTIVEWNKNNRNSLLIHVGDIGLDIFNLTLTAEKLSKNNNTMYVVAGNHDLLELFDGRELGKNKSVKLLSRYATEIINNERYVFVGGGTSLDRHYRRQFNKFHPDKENWFREDEAVQYCNEIESLYQIDVLITHTAPRRFVPNLNPFFLQAFLKDDPQLQEDLDREDLVMNQYYTAAKYRGVKDYFFGHFHRHNVMYDEKTRIHLLNIDELYLFS